LTTLIASKRATVVQSKLLATLDKIPAPLILENWALPAVKGVSSTQQVHTAASSLLTRREIFLTPSVNADNSILTTLHLRVNAIAEEKRSGGVLVSMTFTTPTSLLEVRAGSGDVIAITGSHFEGEETEKLLSRMAGLPGSKNAAPVDANQQAQPLKQMMMLVTPRIAPAP
jgi:hypothetical protein